MCRLRMVEPDEAQGPVRDLFQKLILVPNVLCQMASSEPVLAAFAAHQASLDRYKLSARYRKMISLAVSQFNDCSYCIALHTASAVDAGILTSKECLEARRMVSADAKAGAILRFTREVLKNRGKVDDDLMQLMRARGFDDQTLVEAVAIISFIMLANYVANIGKPELDFCEPPPID